jgi:hypothetical protein
VTSSEGDLRQRRPTPWTQGVMDLLSDWERRAAASSETHYQIAGRLSKANVRLGVPVVILTTFIGTSVFATLEENVATEFRIAVGGLSAVAAVLASLQTFLRLAERSEKHRASAELWAAVRREIAEMVALHPTYLASRGDPKSYLDDLRRRMDEISAQSPEMGDRHWGRAQGRYGLTYEPRPAQAAEAAALQPPATASS